MKLRVKPSLLLLPNWHQHDRVAYNKRRTLTMRTTHAKELKPVDERVTARVPTSTRSIIERAAAIYGSTINQFIVQAAVERANEVLQSIETIKLSARDAKTFLDALAKPPKPNKKLLGAVRYHGRLVESRD
jgi:uncharacterized protein (DUF1778 family)